MTESVSTSTAAPGARVRDELSELLRRDLLGPWGGEHEEFAARGDSPRDRYMLGLLAPQDAAGSAASAVEESDRFVMADADPDAEDGDGEASGPSQSTAMFPSSFGLTFAVPVAVESLVATASWGRYETAASETERSEKTGKPVRVWRRTPCEGDVVLDLTKSGTVGDSVPGFDDVVVRWRSRTRGAHRVVTVFLVNEQQADAPTEATPTAASAAESTEEQESPSRAKERAWLFQARLAIQAMDGSAVFLPREDLRGPAPEASHPEIAGLRMLYRGCPEHAVGHGVSVTVDADSGSSSDNEDSATVNAIAPAANGSSCAVKVATEAMPSYDVPQTEAPRPDAVEGMGDLVLDMERLAGATREQARAWLSPLHVAYRTWISEQQARIDSEPDLAEHATAAREALRKAAEAADRIEAGIELLMRDDKAWQSFRFMNKAMAMQRQRTEAIREREENNLTLTQALAAVDHPSKRSWRAFQIAFVLINLPALVDPGHPDRRVTEQALADLLFFPTGGGKTEAYLGLTAFTFAIRRLQGKVNGKDGGAGMAVLMRYTLRLLTAQQFTRAATLVCAAEVLRRESTMNDLPSLGDSLFRIGLWVGSGVTPNRYEDAKQAVDDARNVTDGKPSHGPSPMPLRSCPWCGCETDPAKHMMYDPARRRVILYCGDPTGRCPFTEAKNPSEGLPITTVDEEIYRDPPSLVIATVDKFAQLPWNGATAHLFGHVTVKCDRHGYKHADGGRVCDTDSHNARGNLPRAVTNPVDPLRPPDLIIQDELHLISGALGTMVGLYETTVDQLTTWTYNGDPVRAKVIASTATVRRAAEQVHHLFQRSLAVFPPPGLDASDAFFARQVPVSPERPGRRYLGVCAPGYRVKGLQIRVASSMLTMGQYLFDTYGEDADAYQTLVSYFGSLRDLGGMRRLVEDDVAIRMRRPNHGLPPRIRPNVQELTSRMPSARIPDTLKELERTFDPQFKSTDALTERRRAEKARPRTAADKALLKAHNEAAKTLPIDVLLATNMFATGVDVQRLALMLNNGQAKTTAEYIQATSRVGRDADRPGLVVTLYNWARPRDLSHYETFEHYHETFYSQVEALSVTPFSPRALDRGLTGAFMGALRNAEAEFNPNRAPHGIDRNDPRVQELIEVFADRAEAVTGDRNAGDLVRELLRNRLDEWQTRKRTAEGSVLTYKRQRDGVAAALLAEPSEGAWQMWTAPQSLRETEDEINLLLRPDDDSILTAPDFTTRTHRGAPADTASTADTDQGATS